MGTSDKSGPQGVLGIWGEGLFIFRELGSTANYLRGAGEQAHTFGDLGSTANFFLRNEANVLLRIFYYNAMGAFFKH